MTNNRPPSDSEQPLAGTRLGKYQIHGAIGRGGMGTVYRAYDPALDRYVALKVLDPHLAWEEEFVRRFLREARAAARLRHPNVVTIYDVGRASGWYYFAMHYLEGRTLAEIIQHRGAFPLEDTLRIVRPLADALDYAHGQGLIHRDVKPSNIIIGDDDSITLTDFGIVRAAQGTRLTKAGTVMGTPEYMSPEQASGDEIDRHTDQYALAVVVYEMLAGKVPFKSESTPTLLYKIVHEAPPPLETVRPDLPKTAAEAVDRALTKEPSERYDSCSEFVTALKRQEEPVPSPVAAADAASPAPPQRPKRRRNTLLLGLGGVGLAIVGLLCLGVAVIAVVVALSATGDRGSSPQPPAVTATSPSTRGDVASPSPQLPSTAGTSTAVPATSTAASAPSNILLQDGFGDPGSGWETGEYETGSVGYEDGVYSVVAFGGGAPMWGVADRFMTDVIIEVDATQVSAGPEDDNEYGVGCRVQPDGDGHYLSISGDGYYAIWVNYGPDWIALVDWTTSDAIRTGNATNHIRAVCDGPTLSLTVNGEHLATVEDTTFSGGDIALTATSYEDAATQVVFDDLVVYAAPE